MTRRRDSNRCTTASESTRLSATHLNWNTLITTASRVGVQSNPHTATSNSYHVETLLDGMSTRSVTQRELFHAAQQNDFKAVVDYLHVILDEAADSSSSEIKSKNGARARKNTVIKTLLEPKTRNSLLHYACDNGNIEACKILLMTDGMSDAFLNEPNAFGHTALFYAASSGKLPLVKWLISNCADIDTDYSDRDDVAPRDGDLGIFTPLQIAAFKGHEDIVNFLVECNASLSGASRNGKTALHFASSQNHKNIVKILLEGGADAHACDDEGKTPVDLAPASLLPVLLPDEHGGGADQDEDDDHVEGKRIDDDEEDEDDDGFRGKGSKQAAVEAMRAAFGSDVTRQFRDKLWKTRVQAIQDATLTMQNSGAGKNGAKLFDGACEMIVQAMQDAVSQVVSSCCTGLLKAAFTSAMAGGVHDFHTAKFHQSRPQIKKIADLLLLRGAASNEKDASEAVVSLLFLICKSGDMTRYLTGHITGMIQFTPSTAVMQSPVKTSDTNSSTATSWRLQLVAIKILNTIASQYRLDDAASGLSFTEAIKISTAALENASVHVRSASIDLLVQCLLIRCEQSDMSGSIDAIFEQMKNWSEAIFKQHNVVLKPSIQAKINNGLKNALQQSKRINTVAESSAEQRPSTAKPLALPLDGASSGESGAVVSPRSKGAQKEDDLPYAEPIQEQLKDDAAPVLACFGEKVARCLFSFAWAPRVEALSLLQYQVESKELSFRGSRATEMLEAMQKTLLLALQDRVNSVYEAGVALLMEFAIALNTAVSNSSSQRSAVQDQIRPLIPRLLAKLGDTKTRLHVTTEDALLLLSRQEASLGPEYLLDEMIACDRNSSLQSLSATYVSNKLMVVSKLLLEFGVKEATDQPGVLVLKLILQPALQVFEHRDPSVRHIALQIVADTVKVARAAAMPFLDALARASRQKIIAKLVEKGVLESDLLMDEVDDFELGTASEQPVRPGTSGGIRPPTASGSSTKHRPALSNRSLSSGPSTSSSLSSSAASVAQAPPLPYGTALTKEQEATYASLIECLGEQLVRCLLDKAWAQREAAVREIERLVICTANGKLPADKALAKSPEMLQILSQCVELGLNDTVARVFQCTLCLCQLIAAEFVPLAMAGENTIDGGDVVDGFLERMVSAALQKFGDTKQRLRADCVTLLHSLASLSHVGPKRMCRTLCSKYTQLLEMGSAAFAASPLVGAELFKLFSMLIRDAYATPKDTNHPDLREILSLLTGALENKHVDVRNAAIDTYTTIYEVTNGGAGSVDLDLQGFLSQLKPAIRDAITRKVIQVSKLSLPAPLGLAEDDGCAGGVHEIDSSRQQPLALDINKLRHLCAKEITDLLTSSSAGQRCVGVDKLLAMFLDAPRNPHFKGAWEISCLLTKQLLLDGTAGVCLAAFQLLCLVVDPPTPSSCEFGIPWGEWGVHLILGSTIRSVVQQSANPSVRVRTQVKSVLDLVASKSAAGRNAVCNAILSAPEQRDLTNETSKTNRKVALCKLRWQLMLRLEMMHQLLTEKESPFNVASLSHAPGAATPTLARRKSSSSSSAAKSNGVDTLNVENVVPFLGSVMVHPSPMVRGAARKIMLTLKNQSVSTGDEVTRFVAQDCSPSLQRRLQPLLSGDGEDTDDNNMAYADHFSADDATVVRGSRASHVRRVAALRPPRSVPVEEKSLEVDVFPPPHSAPGKSRRSLQTDDDEEFGDYVVKLKPAGQKSQPQQPTRSQVPIWLENAPKKTNGSEPVAKRGDENVGTYKLGTTIAVGGGAANLIKVRRKSSIRSNNGDDDDAYRTAY